MSLACSGSSRSGVDGLRNHASDPCGRQPTSHSTSRKRSALSTVNSLVLPYMIRSASASLNSTSSLRVLLRIPFTPSHSLSTTSGSTVTLKRRHSPKDGGKSLSAGSKTRQARTKDTEKPRRRSDSRSGAAQRAEVSKSPLLKPYVLAQRLTRMCDDGNLDEAVAHLQSMPLEAQNVSTWTTVIYRMLRAERYQAAYRLYIDVCSSP